MTPDLQLHYTGDSLFFFFQHCLFGLRASVQVQEHQGEAVNDRNLIMKIKSSDSSA